MSEPKSPNIVGQISVSLNGPDNVGKTTQIFYIPECFEVRSSIHNYDDIMSELFENNALNEWWFKNSTDKEFVSVIMRAVTKRATISSTSKDLLIYDRGGLMFEAVCIATIACKNKCNLGQAQTIYNAIKENLGFNVPVEDIRILLKHGKSARDSLQITLDREHSYDDVYEKYQELLQHQLEIQESENVYTNVIDVTNMSVIEVNNEIRLIIGKYTSTSSTAIKHLKPMFEHVHAIIAFGGMSESGKSTFAEGTCKKLEDNGVKCNRLKIGYFMELASFSLGSDSYQLSEEKQASLLVKQLNHYLSCHYWLQAITIESLHWLGVTQALKQILGDLLQIVFVDVPLDIRMMRSLIDTYDFQANDKVKISRGADKIKTETDCFILNNGKDCSFDKSIDNIYSMLKLKSKIIAIQSLCARYSGNINFFSQKFLLSAGSVLLNKSSRQVCLIHKLGGRKEWLLPKGRKNINESLEDTAIRETYEETGYHCSLLPVVMETRATPGNDEHVIDRSCKMNIITEPIMISLRQIGGSEKNQKLVFWYMAQVDEEKLWEPNTQMENENFESRLVSLNEANQLLTYDCDKELVQRAFKLFDKTYPIQ